MLSQVRVVPLLVPPVTVQLFARTTRIKIKQSLSQGIKIIQQCFAMHRQSIPIIAWDKRQQVHLMAAILVIQLHNKIDVDHGQGLVKYP